MGFTLAEDLMKSVTAMALTMGECNDAVPIPDSGNQVLVRAGSTAFVERKTMKGVLMIPVELKTLVHGVEKQELFCVCTK